MQRLNNRRLSILAALLCSGAAAVSSAHAQCATYSIANGPATFIQATDDIGLYADDFVASVNLPFFVTLYGTSYGSVTVSTNGNLQFGSSSASFFNGCLPSDNFAGATILPFWDDQYTDDPTSGQGIFTRLSGALGSQVFVIEWRTEYCCNDGAPINDYEVIFYENQTYFDVVYSQLSDRGSATIGVQGSASGPFTELECNQAGPTAGTSLRFSCQATEPSVACCTDGVCAIVTQSQCVRPSIGTLNGVCSPNPCPQVPANDLCEAAAVAHVGVNTGTLLLAHHDGGESCTFGFFGVDVYYTFTPATTSAYLIDTCADVGFDTVLSAHSGCPATEANQLPGACGDNGCDFTRGPALIAPVLTAGVPYIIRVATFAPDTTQLPFHLSIQPVGAGACCDNFSGDCTVSVQVQCDTAIATYIGDGTTCTPTPCPPTNPTAFGYSDPNPVAELAPTNLFVSVNPGNNPPSSGLSVSVNTSSVSGTLQTILHDDGAAPDEFPNDNVFSGTVTTNVPAADYMLSFSVSDAQNRTASGDISLTIFGVPGACCAAGNCSVATSQLACTQGGGTYLGAGTICGGPWYTQAPSSLAFRDISTTGTLLTGFSDGFGENTDDGAVSIPIGFFFSYLGTSYSDVSVCTNGFIQFGGAADTIYVNQPIPTQDDPNNMICPLWDDLYVTDGAVYVLHEGVSPNQKLTISWQNVPQFGDTDSNSFQVVLHENGNFEFVYGLITAEADPGDYTIGFENSTGFGGLSVAGSTIGAGGTALAFTSVTLPNPCGQQATGACCCGSSCSLTTSAACSGAGRTFSGGGTACNVINNFTTPCCKGDYNKTGGVPTVQDIFDFLTGYFSTSPCADTNSSGSVSVQDIFDFLSAYFGGC